MRLLVRVPGATALLGFILRGTSLLHFVSHPLRNRALRLAPRSSREFLERFSVVHPMPCPHNSVPVHPRSFVSPLRLLFAGRLTRAKGVHVLLHAMARAPASMRAPSLLTIAGDGPARSGVEAMARDLGLADSVSFIGMVPSSGLAELYDAHDVLVIPSLPGSDPDLAEGVPSVLLDAMSRGLVPVVSACGGMPDVVRGGETCGVLFAPGNVSELAGCLEALSSNSDLCTELSASARAVSLGFSQDSLLGIYGLTTTRSGNRFE